MRQKVREYEPIGKRTYITRTYDGIGEFFLIKGLVSIITFLFKLFLWYPIKYTIGLPFVILGKLFNKE